MAVTMALRSTEATIRTVQPEFLFLQQNIIWDGVIHCETGGDPCRVSHKTGGTCWNSMQNEASRDITACSLALEAPSVHQRLLDAEGTIK